MVIGEVLRTVGIGQGDVPEGGTAADLVPEGAEPAGVEPGDPEVAPHGVVLVVAVGGGLELGEDAGGCAVDAAPAADLGHVPAHLGEVHDDPQGCARDQASLDRLGGVECRVVLIGIIDAGEVGRLASEEQGCPRAHIDVAVDGQARRARSPDDVVGKRCHQGGTGFDGDVAGDDHLTVIDRAHAGDRHRAVGPGGERTRRRRSAGAGEGGRRGAARSAAREAPEAERRDQHDPEHQGERQSEPGPATARSPGPYLPSVRAGHCRLNRAHRARLRYSSMLVPAAPRNPMPLP